MAYEELPKLTGKAHSLSLDAREKLNIKGVDDVRGFDDCLVVLSTAQGDLNIRGQGLHIERIDLDTGVLELKGHIQELSYDEPRKTVSLWARLFG